MNRALVLGLALSLLVASCSGDEGEARQQQGDPPATSTGELDEFGIFADTRRQIPAEGVLPFDVIATLYADEAWKRRFVRIPEGKAITYANEGSWEWPDGSIIAKTFSFPLDMRDPSLGERLVETRLLIKEEGKWTARTYVWNEEQTTTERVRVGGIVPLTYIDAAGTTRSLDYRVPNENQCVLCHSTNNVLEPLGPVTKMLARDYDYGDGRGPVDQIDHWASLGILKGDIPEKQARPSLVNPFGDAPLEDRARSYLDVNCSHCHRPGGAASATNLLLLANLTNPHDYGVCRTPVATGPASGGLHYDIVPGKPDESILVHRMSSTAPEVKMPQIANQTVDQAGLALIREWIEQMPAKSCGGDGS